MIYNSLHIHCVSLNFQTIEKETLELLENLSLNYNSELLNKFKEKLGFSFEHIAIIKKCNAIIILVVTDIDLSSDCFKGRILKCWDEISKGEITQALNYIKFYKNEKAIQYLGECAVGLHSITLGDSQVFSQIFNALLLSTELQTNHNAIYVITKWLKKILHETTGKTNIFKGNTSLERIACNILKTQITNNDKICVIGMGMSGKLVSKILNNEMNYNLMVANRSLDEDTKNIYRKKYKAEIVELEDFQKITKCGAMVIALTNNDTTKKYSKKLDEYIKKNEKDILILDLSTPPFHIKATPNDRHYIDIKHLSKIANQTKDERKKEINKTKDIIKNLVCECWDGIQYEFNKNNILKQRKTNLKKLNQEKNNLVHTRNHALVAIRKFLSSKEFIEVQTPCIVGVSTDPPKVDSGSTLNLTWPGGNFAFLRQSNQLYKQMLVCSNIDKIFEIGPFWRAETKNSFQHLQETIGLDVELANPPSLDKIMELAFNLIKEISTYLISQKIKNTFNLQNIEFANIPIISYTKAIALLKNAGFEISYGEDLTISGEIELNEIIKSKYNCELFFIKHYPDTIKKFYTKKTSNGTTETFDLIFRGWELASGALRETNRAEIEKSMRLSNIDPQNYTFYLSIIENSRMHGGFGLGFDRLIAKLLSKETIHDAVVFPRTFNKLIP